MKAVLNIGIISTWHVHTKDYAKQIEESGKAVIKAVWDEDPERGAEWAKEHNTAFEADYDTFLARKDIDAVVCVSATTAHPELLSKAARAGKHIFTEKLLATSTADCEELCRVIKESGITFTISLPLRADAKMLYAKKLIDEGTLGKVTGARMRRSHSGVSDGWLPKHWFDVSKSGGGALMDLGAHPVYLMSFFFGAPKRVSSIMTNLYGTTSDENAVAVAEFGGGVIGMMETAFVTYGVPDLLEIYGTEGSVFIHGKEVELVTKAGSTVNPELPASLLSPCMQFVDACLSGTGTPKYLGLDDSLVMTKIIEAAYASDKTGTTITIK